MNKTYKDTDLREALRRKYSDTPQLPADFMAKMEGRMKDWQAGDGGKNGGADDGSDGADAGSGGADAGSDGKTVGNKRARLWGWLSIAASILLIIGIGSTMWPQHEQPTGPLLAKTTEQPKQEAPMVEEESDVQEAAKEKQTDVPVPVRTGQTKGSWNKEQQRQAANQKMAEDRPTATSEDTESDNDPNLHYAAYEMTKDTVAYQDPARVDDYIFQLAEHHRVKQGQLKCSLPADSSVVSNVYVFPDKDEVNLFSRLLQVACWFDSKTPGYHLNFSQQQFFFELKDMRRQLQYRWIAERINGRILFYSTHAPIGAEASSACYQEYRNELMYQNSINLKTKKI